LSSAVTARNLHAMQFETKVVPRLEDLALRAPRVAPPASLAAFCTGERYDCLAHAYGKSYPDYVRAMLGDYDNAPDVVAYPRNEAEISAAMHWVGDVSASLTPFGGGSSICGGVEPRVDGRPSRMTFAISATLSKWITIARSLDRR
jgi:alkyldihydroxyacetonephosphate synthase